MNILIAFLVGVVSAIVVFWLIGFVVFHSTDLLKIASRFVAKLPAMSWLAIRGYGSYFVALVLAFVFVFYPGSGLGESLKSILDLTGIEFNPILVKLLSAFLVSLIAAAQQDSGKMPTPLLSSQTSK